MITNIDRLIRIETSKAIKAVLESRLSQDGEDERRQQKRQQDAISTRGLHASDNSSKQDEAEDDDSEDQKKEKSEKKEKTSTPDRQEDRTKGRGTADSPKIRSPKKDQLENPTVDMAIDKLNGLRGGRSLKDPEVKKSFSQYYDGLTVPEKRSLLLFLTGIAQVLAGTEVGAEAAEPQDAGLRVKDNVSKAPGKRTHRDKDVASEEGTASNPIVVGEVASKHSVLRALREYSKYQ